MLKIIIVLLIASIILYAIFGIWGVIIPSVLFVGVVIAGIINANKNPTSVTLITQTNNSNTSDSSWSNFPLDTEIDIGYVSMFIKYRDKEGAITERSIEAKKIGISGNRLYIKGFCHTANDERTFRIDRIIETIAYGKNINIMVFVCDKCKDREGFNKCLLSGINFCLTGTLKIMTRKQARERIEAFGGGFHKEIRYDTHFLVAENAERKTGKLIEAKAHGVTIIDENTFVDYITYPIKAQTAKRIIKDEYEYYKESVENDTDHKKKKYEGVETSATIVNENKNLPLWGYSFCFTGEFVSIKRSEAEQKVRELGGHVKSSVANGLSYLVTGDPASSSAKNKKARELGVIVIGEDEFLALLEKATNQL
jgi:NAD-dependent DNA ligase